MVLLAFGNVSSVTAAPAPIRIDAGSPNTYTDTAGHLWSADTDFVDGDTASRGPIQITGTTDPTLYQTERWGLSGYRIPVVNGQYVSGAGSTTSAYASAVLADQPMAYWRLNETSGSTAADDSGNRQTANITGGVTRGVSGALAQDVNTAFGFDGQSGYVRDNTSLSVGSDFTIEAWVKSSSANQSVPLVSLVGPQSQSSRTLYLDRQRFRGMADVSSKWPTYSVDSNAAYDVTAWHHLVFVTQAATSLALYVDGALAGSMVMPAVSGFSGNAVLAWSDDPAFSKFGGNLDEVALYATALPAARISAHYAAGIGANSTNATGTPTDGPGSSTSPTCTGTLQSAINAAAPGAVLHLPPCVYRESVVISTPITLDGQNQAEIRGSDVWTAWNASGSYWISAAVVPSLGTDSSGAAYVNQFQAANLEQVFVDGAPLQHVPSNPGGGQFALDSGRHVILATNPSGHLVEVTTRKKWITINADNVTVMNLNFHHAATAANEHAIGNDDHVNFVLSNSTLTDAHGMMLGLGGGNVYSQILNNTLAAAGDLAIGSYKSGYALIQGNMLRHNGYGGWDPNWQAGGVKIVSGNNVLLDSNTAWDNIGTGLWCDIGCRDVTISNNKVHDNTGSGIEFEISTGAHIYGNSVWNTPLGIAAIFISNSGSAEVNNNCVYNSAPALFVYNDYRSDSVPVTNNFVHDNIAIMTGDGQISLGFGDYGTGVIATPSANNTGLNNAFWYPIPETGQQRFRYGNSIFSSIGGFGATAGGVGSWYMSSSQKDQALAAAGIAR
ncbi:MAG: right-handed parallel beta-helix repeat-containing protein [Chloroflexi bacterium]|nr:right-handed parallel beta-helix repeat-containing protein [Chloroflexota bacterium]